MAAAGEPVAAIFGLEALERVKGFSPSEMALPNHPDVAYAFVRTLVDCGYRWVLVQEHTVEEPATAVVLGGSPDLRWPASHRGPVFSVRIIVPIEVDRIRY